MQTTLERSGWFKASRMGGCIRYYVRIFTLILWISILVLGVTSVIGLAIMSGTGECTIEGPSANFAFAILLAFVYSIWATNGGARFLTRFGTPRTSVWLSTIASVALFMAILLLCTLLLNTLLSGAVLLLSNVNPEEFRVVEYGNDALTSSEVFSKGLSESLKALPMQLLWIVEWSCIFCFLGSCLRRNKWLTIGILVGAPMVLGITMLIPAVRETVAALRADQSQLFVVGIKWLGWISKVTEWITKNWQFVQGAAAIAALALSRIIMKNTPQP